MLLRLFVVLSTLSFVCSPVSYYNCKKNDIDLLALRLNTNSYQMYLLAYLLKYKIYNDIKCNLECDKDSIALNCIKAKSKKQTGYIDLNKCEIMLNTDRYAKILKIVQDKSGKDAIIWFSPVEPGKCKLIIKRLSDGLCYEREIIVDSTNVIITGYR